MLADDFFYGTQLYSQKLQSLCGPLARYLGITEAIYINIDPQGGALNVSTHPGWTQRFLEERYYQLDPFMVHPDNIQSGFSFDGAHESHDFKDKFLHDAVVRFNMCHSFVYIEKMISGGYFGFAFATSKNNPEMIDRLMNESQVVKKMIRHLNKQLITTLRDLEEHRMDFAALKGDLFHTQKGIIIKKQNDHDHKIQLLSELGLLHGTQQHPDLLRKIFSFSEEINALKVHLSTQNVKKMTRHLNLGITNITTYIRLFNAQVQPCH